MRMVNKGKKTLTSEQTVFEEWVLRELRLPDGECDEKNARYDKL